MTQARSGALAMPGGPQMTRWPCQLESRGGQK